MWKSGLTGIVLVLALAGCGQSDSGSEADAGAADGGDQAMSSDDAGSSGATGSGGTCFDVADCGDGQQMMFGVSQEDCADANGSSWMAEGGSCEAL